MLKELERLIALQRVDLEIRDLLQDQEELPASLLALQQRVQETEAEIRIREEEIAARRRQQRDLEGEVALLEEGITRSRQRLMEIKDNIEYKAMLKEIGFKEDRKDQKETEVLEILEQIAQLTGELAALQEELAQRQKALAQEEQAIQTELAANQQRLTQLQLERNALEQGIDRSLLKRYDFIRSRRNGAALAAVRDGVCQACHMNLPPQQFIDLQLDTGLMTCPHCQRIIYYQPPEEPPEAEAVA